MQINIFYLKKEETGIYCNLLSWVSKFLFFIEYIRLSKYLQDNSFSTAIKSQKCVNSFKAVQEYFGQQSFIKDG